MTALAFHALPVIPAVAAEPKLRHSAHSRGIHAPAPTLPEVPAERKLRHSARSRGIHLRLPTLQPDNPAPSARHHGYCDFAQYDGVGRVTVCAEADDDVGRVTVSLPPTRSPSLHALPSFQQWPQNPNFVIPRTVAESMPLPPPFPKYPQNASFVIPRAVAESISACQRFNQIIQRPLHATMDTATSRSMTALVG